MKNDLDDLLATKLKDMSLEFMKDENLVPCFKVSYSPRTTFYYIEMPGFTDTYSMGPLEDTLRIIVNRLKVTEPSTKSKLT